MQDKSGREWLSRAGEDPGEELWEEDVPSPRLKARVYSAMIREQEISGPIESLTASRANGSGLCSFETLVQITPVGEAAKSYFFCRTCHARVLAERMERVALPWSGCPYAQFQRG